MFTIRLVLSYDRVRVSVGLGLLKGVVGLGYEGAQGFCRIRATEKLEPLPQW